MFKSSFKKKIKERIEISKLLQHLKDSFAKNQTKSFLYVCNAKKNDRHLKERLSIFCPIDVKITNYKFIFYS